MTHRKLTLATGFAAGLSLTALVAYAADSLTIDANGIRLGANLNFGNRLGALITLWNPGFTIGIQHSTMYFRSDRDFARFYGAVAELGRLDAAARREALRHIGEPNTIRTEAASIAPEAAVMRIR